MFLTFDQKFSIGEKSGEYGGKKTSRAPTASINGRTAAAWWMEQLSITTQAPSHNLGTSRVATNASKVSPSQVPSRPATPTTPVRLKPATRETCLPRLGCSPGALTLERPGKASHQAKVYTTLINEDQILHPHVSHSLPVISAGLLHPITALFTGMQRFFFGASDSNAAAHDTSSAHSP